MHATDSKFARNYEGPFVVTEAFTNGVYKLRTFDGQPLPGIVNGDWLKKFYQ